MLWHCEAGNSNQYTMFLRSERPCSEGMARSLPVLLQGEQISMVYAAATKKCDSLLHDVTQCKGRMPGVQSTGNYRHQHHVIHKNNLRLFSLLYY